MPCHAMRCNAARSASHRIAAHRVASAELALPLNQPFLMAVSLHSEVGQGETEGVAAATIVER